MDLPTTAKAAILTQQHQPLVVDQIHLPSELDVGQVLVEVLYSGICGSQIGEINGVKGPDKYLPHLLGHEGCGRVLAVGPGVSQLEPGDTVVMHWRKGNGINAKPAHYTWNNKPLNAGQITTFNDYAVVSENRLTRIPDNFDHKLAPLLGCAVTTGFGVVQNDACLGIGESVVVFGAGGVGLNIIQAAAMVSAYPIIAIDRYDSKLKLAATLGATHTINARNMDVRQTLNHITRGTLLDVAIDNTGNTSVIESCYQLTHAQGRVILVGVPCHHENINIHSLPLHFGKTLTGSHGGQSRPAIDIPRLVTLHQAGRLELSALITHEYSLNNINQAIHDIREGIVTGRCLIYF